MHTYILPLKIVVKRKGKKHVPNVPQGKIKLTWALRQLAHPSHPACHSTWAHCLTCRGIHGPWSGIWTVVGRSRKRTGPTQWWHKYAVSSHHLSCWLPPPSVSCPMPQQHLGSNTISSVCSYALHGVTVIQLRFFKITFSLTRPSVSKYKLYIQI